MPINKTKLTTASTGIFFSVALLLSIGVAAFAYSSMRVFEERAIWVQHTHTVLNTLEEAHSAFRDTVSSARGFALSGNDEYRGNFEAGVRQVNSLMHELRQLLRDNGPQLAQLQELEDLMRQRLTLARKLLEAQPVPIQSELLLAGKDLSDDIRARFMRMKGAENALLATRSQESATSATVTNLAVVGGSLLSILILLLVYRKLKREVGRRIEAQQKAQAYLDDIEDLYNHAPCGYHSIDEHTGKIVKINDTELKWLGYTRDAVVGRLTHADLLTPESEQRYLDELLPLFLSTREIQGVDLTYRRADGSTFTALINATATPARDGGGVVSRTVMYDISERKRAEEEIKGLNADLKRQALHLHSVNKELESFSYSVSHDLRAPLRAISGYAMILEEDYAEALDEKGREQLQVIRRNVKKMDELINDLLKLAKSTTGELTLERFSMDEPVAQVIAGLKRENPDVEFDVAAMDGVVANRGLITQVWENLLSNAVKFSSKNEHPKVSVTVRTEGEEIIYGVHDNGVGFDMRYAHKLFGTFQRLHRQEEYAGTGIGLALVQRIVIRHTGRVWAEGKPKEGASFYFSLPRKGLFPTPVGGEN
ncbi:CHASE3 domain-containing protein [Herbaspirillum sp. YR522]|uniref:sensor histidine kinase n=1 Tax=Herbaspirillum sp. YR522 TaxID=1144342 RepID=UPI00026FC552|nr:CHASE3 domain-containing protein [Herbaspirillum sp. YR522]EJM95681.1 PAS domain S-box [Herbaspirillum sp. YR522]